MTFFSRHISVSINCLTARVYDFSSNSKNLPKWAAGLSGSIQQIGRDWIADSTMGRVRVKFAGKNSFGVLDHDVTLPSGKKFSNPMRVFPNNDGSEVVFTFYRRPDMTDRMFAKDANAVAKDLQALKTLLANTPADKDVRMFS